jgi:aspartyl-tRNA(Asn)/glutamyl-tRNA(Gln) amidotransferase subunit B
MELKDSRIAPAQLAAMVKMIDSGTISGKQAKEVLAVMFATGEDPDKIAQDRGLEQVSDAGELEAAVDEVIAANDDAAQKVREGNLNTIGFLVGQVMKKTRGQANPGIVNELLRKKLT